MDAFLIFDDTAFPIPPGDLIRIGSASGCDIQLENDAYISRRHCSVSFVNGQLSIVDLDSSHGTLVNGTELGRDPVVLQSGDQIQVGQSSLTVKLDASPSA